jgi:hypothetical protein
LACDSSCPGFFPGRPFEGPASGRAGSELQGRPAASHVTASRSQACQWPSGKWGAQPMQPATGRRVVMVAVRGGAARCGGLFWAATAPPAGRASESHLSLTAPGPSGWPAPGSPVRKFPLPGRGGPKIPAWGNSALPRHHGIGLRLGYIWHMLSLTTSGYYSTKPTEARLMSPDLGQEGPGWQTRTKELSGFRS